MKAQVSKSVVEGGGGYIDINVGEHFGRVQVFWIDERNTREEAEELAQRICAMMNGVSQNTPAIQPENMALPDLCPSAFNAPKVSRVRRQCRNCDQFYWDYQNERIRRCFGCLTHSEQNDYMARHKTRTSSYTSLRL